MRFPFLATNRSVRNLKKDFDIHRHHNVGNFALHGKGISDLARKLLVLEGRVNKLEHIHRVIKPFKLYTPEEWTRMSHKRRAAFLAKLPAIERQQYKRTVEGFKHGRKKGK